MQAANEGARLAGVDPNTSSVGIRVDLPFEQDCQTGPQVLDILREHHDRWKANQEATS